MFCAVFDLDGTLADTAGDLLAAANACFEAEGLYPPLTPSDRQTALLGGRAMLTLGAEKLDLDDIPSFVDANYENLLAYYRESLDTHTKLYPDVEAVLKRLKESDWKLAVCTNKPIDLATPLLKSLGVYDLMDAVIGARSLPVSKPNPEPLLETLRLAGAQPERSVLIGDSTTDYNTARNAGTAILLVDFDESNIGDEFPDAPLVKNFVALETWLQDWRVLASQ